MATASLTLETKFLLDFEKYIFYLNCEQKAHLFLHFVPYPHLSKALFLTLLSLKKK